MNKLLFVNYHFIIDHWFFNDFIETAEKVSGGENVYISGFQPPFKHIVSPLIVFAPYGSPKLHSLVSQITSVDKVFVHWFHNEVWSVIERLDINIDVYLFFWGGDFVSQTKELRDFIYDPLTKKVIRKLNRFTLSVASLSLRKNIQNLKRLINRQITAKQKLTDDLRIRKLFFKRLNYFCHWNELDLVNMVSVYGGNPKFVSFFYDPQLRLVDNLQIDSSIKKDKIVKIWLGNSDAEANNHLDAIEALTKYKNENISIICPLSYGVNASYSNRVTRVGQDVFGDKWTSLTEFLSLEEYLNLQSSVDIVVMFHNRTQAAGNVFSFLKMGKKVFLKGQSTLFNFLEQKNIVVFDSNSIRRLAFEDFCKPINNHQINNNSIIVSHLFSQEVKECLYQNILNAYSDN